MTKRKICSKAVNESEKAVKFDFATGESYEVKVDQFPPHIQQMFALHGMSQKLGDTYAIGADEPVSVGVAKFLQSLENLEQGLWNAKPDQKGRLAEAVARIKGVAVDKAREFLQSLDDESIKTLKASSAVKVALAEIDKERAQERAATDSGAADDILAALAQ